MNVAAYIINRRIPYAAQRASVLTLIPSPLVLGMNHLPKIIIPYPRGGIGK
jgi:hypothetical protein